jgi:tetratricopeptide (TPR) repeat protein/predicted Ser/Thr protein kinase
MSIEPGRTLSHYRLLEPIGAGGMGVVWKAEDTRLGRTVALKLLPADRARDEARRRMFLEEARLAATVIDARIVQVHELDREGDHDFIVMEYVEGQPLNALIQGRPLPPVRVAQLGEQVARALARAHRRGLLHRDLKPANILVTAEGDVKVADFGLARFLGSAIVADSAAHTLTRPAVEGDPESRGAPGDRIAGTLAYMSPEQARGESLDPRSDIFSLGIVLYEMTTGRRPFVGGTGSDVLRDLLKARPVAVHERVAQVPVDLDRIIHKAMAPLPADRYQTMEDLAVDLKRLSRDLETGSAPSFEEIRAARRPSRRRRGAWIAAAVGAVILGIAAGFVVFRSGRPTAGSSGRDLLVLPMEVHGQADGAAYVGKAFAEAVAANLARAEGIRILPVPEAGELPADGSLSRAKAALSVGADAFLSGSLSRDGASLHASVSLVDARENRILWGVVRDVKGDDLGTLASSLAHEITRRLGATAPHLYESFLYATGGAEMSASPLTSEALGAARRFDPVASLETARRLVQAFPKEPEAHVLLAAALLLKGFGMGPFTPERKAFDESLSALQALDPGTPWDDFFRAEFLTRDGRYRDAIDIFTQGLSRDDLAPSARSLFLSLRAQAHRDLGDTQAALADLGEALHLDPTSDVTFSIYGHTLEVAGRLDEALEKARQAVALNPLGPQNNRGLAQVLYQLGRWEESIAPRERVCHADPTASNCALWATSLQRAGRVEEAARAAEEAAALPETYEGAYNLACYRALRGDRKEAIRLLRRAYEIYLGPDPYLSLAHDPDLVSLKGEPEFERLVAEIAKRNEPAPSPGGSTP